MSNRKKGWYWPYAILASIFFIIGAAGATIYVAVQNPVEMSDMDMQDYHHYDRNANDIISAKINFDRKYDLSYHSHSFKQDDAVVSYRVVDKQGNAVNSAKMNIMVTRPGNHNTDLPFEAPNSVENGIYTFHVGTLPLAGRWNVLAHIVVEDNERYINLKVDTRNDGAFEY